MDEESFLDRIDRLLSPETPEEIARDFAMGAHPVTGTAMDAGNFLMGIRNRDVPRAGISALAALLPFIGAGTLRRVGEGAARKFIGKQPPQVGKLGSKRPRGIKSIRSDARESQFRSYGAERSPWDPDPYEEFNFWDDYDSYPLDMRPYRHNVTYLDPGSRPGGWPRESEFEFYTQPTHVGGEYVRRTRRGSDQLEMFPEVDLAVEIPPTYTSVGRSGIRSLGRAVIEDFEKTHQGLLNVGSLSGVRATGTRGTGRLSTDKIISMLPEEIRKTMPNPMNQQDQFFSWMDDVAIPYVQHTMSLPRSFFFK